MKRTITYSTAVALSLSLCSLGLYGCGEPAESEKTTQPSPSATADGSGDKHADGSGDKHADDSAEQAENNEDGL